MDDKFAGLRAATRTALLDGTGKTPGELRKAVAAGQPPPDLVKLVEKIRTRAYTVTDQDLQALKASYTEDQLFEIVVSAALGAATDRLAAAHRALDEA